MLIRVTRAGVNFADTLVRTNSYLAKATLPLTPGVEVVGIREDDGERVGALCASGGYAEYAVAPAALTFPLAGRRAPTRRRRRCWCRARPHGTCIAQLARLAPGESVVVHSAAGGVGSIAVQLARRLGAGARDRERLERGEARARTRARRGRAIDAAPPEMTDAILAANDGRRVDVVLDAAGGERPSTRRSRRWPRSGGSSSTGSRPPPERGAHRGAAAPLAGGDRLLDGACAGRPGMLADALRELFELVAAGELRTPVGGTYPLAQAARAHIDLAARRTTGKLLIDPWA